MAKPGLYGLMLMVISREMVRSHKCDTISKCRGTRTAGFQALETITGMGLLPTEIQRMVAIEYSGNFFVLRSPETAGTLARQ